MNQTPLNDKIKRAASKRLNELSAHLEGINAQAQRILATRNEIRQRTSKLNSATTRNIANIVRTTRNLPAPEAKPAALPPHRRLTCPERLRNPIEAQAFTDNVEEAFNRIIVNQGTENKMPSAKGTETVFEENLARLRAKQRLKHAQEPRFQPGPARGKESSANRRE
ncbi:TPA: hypothetical protein HA318_02780 [Candidatus Micrarchaeota archaeon]|nr:MAG: hypothetical protein AUJ65_02945 [Candidatus Micrarchaeota archaeon CG1_02_51_15]HII38903.1 hypothetical protein [Candidatus Micrarchaeota archaeon]